MKKTILLSAILSIVLAGCNNVENSNRSSLRAECDSLKIKIESLRDSISILRFSPSDRLYQINTLISEDRFDEARKQIIELKELFPLSNEAIKSDDLNNVITKKEEQNRAENARIKALGYKVFHDNTTANIGDVSFVMSGFTFGKKYTFDYCSDVGEYSYMTADKDNVYLLASLSLSTKEKYASVPNFNLYIIEDGNLKKISYVTDEYASWSSYGAKIGNYDDDSHDFSKVNTVKYKIAAEISIEQSKQPLLLLVKKEGNEVGESLSIEDIKNDYIVVKILNRGKL
ncbi:MAG: hypothetical protein LBC19_01600 [Tannerella sp.]|jgi:hypothetical protein|nr:hypothetical protein [Tannerella sp.]